MCIKNDDVKFTYEWYRTFIETVASERRVTDFENDIQSNEIAVRHDVDYSLRDALRMARLEADCGISTTYCFLVTGPFYNPLSRNAREVITEIAELGHEIGLHFSTHQYWEDEPTEADLSDKVRTEQEILESVTHDDVRLISFHNPPEWVLDRTFAGFSHTYESRFFSTVPYVADSNQRWRSQQPFTNGIPERAQILVHPFLYGTADASVTDRLRRERDAIITELESYMEQMNSLWDGPRGLDSGK